MKIGLHLPRLTYPGGPATLGADLARIARSADDAGVDRLSVMDHVWQIGPHGPVEQDMLEAYTTLGFLAANTSRVSLLTLVTGVTYRDPGLLAKAVTTLDVLSGGRAWLGIGAAWNERESRALGFPFPPLGERFEMLEETLRISHGMFEGEHGSEAAFRGRRFQAERLLNSPQSISRPRVPIMVGGGGERKTLRLVAQYADACNVFGSPEGIARKYEILRRHCEDIGRDPDEIERSTLQNIDLALPGGRGRESAERIVERFGDLADAGAQHVIIGMPDADDAARLEAIGRDIIPAIRDL